MGGQAPARAALEEGRQLIVGASAPHGIVAQPIHGFAPSEARGQLAWIRWFALEVWRSERLSTETLPTVRLGRPTRSTHGYFSYSPKPARNLVRSHEDVGVMSNTLLHELAHAADEEVVPTLVELEVAVPT